jgi:calcium-dependent protein kinase
LGASTANPTQSRVVAATKATAYSEAECLHRARGHEHVVELVDLLEDSTCVYLVMEYCSGGDLMKYVRRSRQFTEKVASLLFGQMLRGVAHCHSRGVVHRDLKPDNFLFVSRTGRAHLKIADFGLAYTISRPDEEMTDAVGSAFFLAPEVIQRRYGRGCDVWSLGVILYLLLSGTVPFGARATKAAQVYEAVQHDKLLFTGGAWVRVSPLARELIAGMLDRDPMRRYTLAQALQHPWVRSEGVAPDTPLDTAIIAAMHNFNATNRLRREALRLVAKSLSAVDLQRLRAQFHLIDRNTDNAISMAELTDAVAAMGLVATQAQLRQLMRDMDADGDGRIDLDEFLAATAELQMVHHQNEIWWAFCEYDRNGDGIITAEEMRSILRDEDVDTIQSYIREYDRDGDGRINYEEWVRMVVPPHIEFHTVTF